MADTYVVKIENGNAKLYRSGGTYVRSICGDVHSGVISGEEVHLTMNNGKVKIYTVGGSFKRTI